MSRSPGLRFGAVRRAITVTLFLAVGGTAQAQELRDFIVDLYGGDGITLDRFGPFPHDAHFTEDSLEILAELNSDISSGIGVFAFNSTVSSFTYDVQTGVPVRSTESLGPLLAERANTVGAGKLNVAVSYSKIEFDEFNGNDISRLRVVFPHEDVVGPPPPPFGPPDGMLTGFELDAVEVLLDLDIEQDVVGLFATYGLTDDWDVGIIVPLIEVDVEADARAQLLFSPGGGPQFHRFGAFGDAPTDRTGGSETGIGDVVLRTKYHFLKDHSSLPEMAARLQLTVPTGDEDDLLGTDETAIEGLVVASKTFGAVTPHVNLGYEASSDSERSNLRYVVGFDTRLFSDKLTGAVEVLGRYFHEQVDSRDHFIDFAIGVKWDPFNAVPINANLIIPLNDEGLRSDLIWSVGLDYTF